MKSLTGITLSDVQSVYSGPEGRLWELIMGEQIHIGGIGSSMDLAERARIAPGSRGVDLCCCTGAGMRFLTRFRHVSHMTGVDATPAMNELGRQRCREQGLSDRIRFVQGDVCSSGLADSMADFVWGEDAWCYVADKPRLIAEAARIVRQGGIIAFTDWVEGANPMSDSQAERFLRFMKFPTIASIPDYCRLLQASGCTVLHAEDTRRFAPCVDLYLQMLSTQLGYDALRILGFDRNMLEAVGQEMQFVRELAHEGRIVQSIVVAARQ